MKVTCKLKSLCQRDRIKQKELAERIGASKDQVNRWCSNRELPSIGYVVRIHKVTGWTLKDMFEESEDK